MSNWLDRARVWIAPATAGAMLLLALTALGRIHHFAALCTAIIIACAMGVALIIERK